MNDILTDSQKALLEATRNSLVNVDNKIISDGYATDYYDLPEDATTLNDLIEYRQMPFAIGNIFKACYRMGQKDGIDELYDLNKILYFAEQRKAWVLKRRGQ